MRTQNDLRDAIRARADLAPTADLLTLAPRTDEHRRRPYLIAAAVLATAAVATGAVVAPSLEAGHRTGSADRTSSAGPPSAGPNAGDTPAAAPAPSLIDSTMRISYRGVGANDSFQTAQAQYIELVAPGFHSREISAYTPGLFHKSLIQDPQPVTVDGVRGYYGGALPWRNDDVSHTDPAHTDPRGSKYASTVPTLAWKVGTRWISVSSDVPGEGVAALLAIARNVRTSDDPVRTPIRIGYLPGGYQLADVDHSLADSEYAGTTSLLGFRRNDRYDYWDWDVHVARTPRQSGSSGPSMIRPVDPEVSRKVGRYTVTVQTLGAITKAQATRVLDSVTIAADPSTPNDSWYDVAQALP